MKKFQFTCIKVSCIMTFMNIKFIIGIAAATLTTISFLPQVFKAARTKRTKDLSLSMYVLFSAGVFLWMIYGLMLGELPVILANFLALVMGLYLVYLKKKYS